MQGLYLFFCVMMCGTDQCLSSDELLQELGSKLKTLKMEKSLIGWDLEELEAATRDAQERESDSDDESGDDLSTHAHS